VRRSRGFAAVDPRGYRGWIMGDVRVLRVVVVSPGDVAEERAVAHTVVEELNRGVASSGRCRLSLWRWEIDARAGIHVEGPQGLIDELMDINDADVVVGIFWRRFGAPTCEAQSGTEHELHRAWAAWRERGRPEVMVYFCTRPYSPMVPEELAQWQRVLEFRDALPEQQLWWRYDSRDEFERLLREHLTRFVLARIAVPAAGQGASQGGRVRFNLPAVAASFTGREEELDALDEAFVVGNRAVVTQEITGLGGVGKSQLAARYAQQRIDNYDLVAWIRAEDGGIADLAQLAAKLDVPVDGLSPGEAAQLALDQFGETTQRWLLVLDNVESPEQLETLLPRTGGGRVLVTSRDRALRQFGPVLTVDVFDIDTASTYLTDRAGRRGDELGARKLAKALGCLPLALSHAAAYCQSGTSFADYLELLSELPAHDLFDRHPELSYAQTVASTWKTSVRAANTEAPLAAGVLEMAAQVGPDAIPKSLFLVLADADTATGRKRLADAFNALARFSLATVDDESVSLHRLLQKTVRDDASAKNDLTAALHALAALQNAFPDDVRSPANWPLCEQLLPHAFALADALEPPRQAATQLISLLNRACDYLTRAEPGERGLAITRVALRHAVRLLGTQHPQTLTTRSQAARASRQAGHTGEALTIFESLLHDHERILGTEHPDTLYTRRNLGLAYQAAGRVDKALAIFELLLPDHERILGIEHHETLASRHHLGFAYLDDGRVDEALAIFEPLLDYDLRILGPEHPDTMTARNSLALAYRAAGRTEEAITIFESVMADRERILGGEHRDTLYTRHNLALTFLFAGRVEESIAILERLLADRERILGIDHPHTLTTRESLARAYHDDARTAEALTI
jgi:tetratricopeptide (TPR) repeat protein